MTAQAAVQPPRHIRSWQGVTPTLARRVYVDPAAALIGQVTLGDDCSVWPMAVVRGDVNVIRVGARTSIQDGSVPPGPRGWTGCGRRLWVRLPPETSPVMVAPTWP